MAICRSFSHCMPTAYHTVSSHNFTQKNFRLRLANFFTFISFFGVALTARRFFIFMFINEITIRFCSGLKNYSLFFFFSRLIPTSEIYRHCGSTACGYWSNKVYPMLRKQNRIDHRYQSVGRALDHQPNGCIICLASPHASRCSLNEFDHQWNS